MKFWPKSNFFMTGIRNVWSKTLNAFLMSIVTINRNNFLLWSLILIISDISLPLSPMNPYVSPNDISVGRTSFSLTESAFKSNLVSTSSNVIGLQFFMYHLSLFFSINFMTASFWEILNSFFCFSIFYRFVKQIIKITKNMTSQNNHKLKWILIMLQTTPWNYKTTIVWSIM